MKTPAIEAPAEAENQFNWPLCYEAENLLLERIGTFLEQNSFARILSERMRDETGTLILRLGRSPRRLGDGRSGTSREAGFTEDPLGETPDGLEATLASGSDAAARA